MTIYEYVLAQVDARERTKDLGWLPARDASGNIQPARRPSARRTSWFRPPNFVWVYV